MTYIHHCASPLGGITMASDGEHLNGLWFDGQKHFGAGLGPDPTETPLPVFDQAEAWLNLYFSGQIPDFTPPLQWHGTEFQDAVWQALLKIPYGQTVTYGALAEKIAAQTGRDHVSPRAVGSAVGRNHISLIVPCHRVVGADGRLTGYAGGLERKEWLLQLERGDASPGFWKDSISEALQHPNTDGGARAARTEKYVRKEESRKNGQAFCTE